MPVDFDLALDIARKREKEEKPTGGVDFDKALETAKARESAESRSTLGDIISGVARGVAIEAPSF